MPTLAYRTEQGAGGQDVNTGATIVAPYVVWDRDAVAVTADQAIAASVSNVP